MTFIIAEVGSNWESFDDCKQSIVQAKLAGADAVKFQLYTSEDLYGIKEPEGRSPDELLRVAALYGGFDRGRIVGKLPREWLPLLKQKADMVGIELMCTAFSPEGLDYVDQFVSRHKIASSDLSYPELLERAKAKGKPTILSTGASSLPDIAMALGVLGREQTTLMYCVSAYPSKNVNLNHLNVLRREFGLPVGYSCHTMDFTAAVCSARHYGATVVEKHFKLRDMDSPDNPHSLNPEEFRQMVKLIKDPDESVGTTFPHPSEKDMLFKYNRRLIVTKDVGVGEEFVYGKNFGAYRSLKDDIKGMSGFAWQHVSGKRSKVLLKAGDSIGPQEFE